MSTQQTTAEEELGLLLKKYSLDAKTGQELLDKVSGKPRVAQTKDMVSILAEQAEIAKYPWKKVESECAAFWKRYSTVTAAEKKTRFERLAKQKQLPPMVVLMMLYLMYTPDKEYGVECLTYLFAFGPLDKIVQYHNYQVFSTLSEPEQTLFGEVLEKCPVPLYPASNELSTLNDELRSITRKSQLSGGGPTTELGDYLGCFGPDFLPSHEGGGYAEPVYNAQGEQIAAVDMTQTENYLGQLHAAITNIGTMIGQSVQVSRGRGYSRGRAQGASRGKGNYRGRGGAAPWNYSGGAVSGEDTTKN